MIYIRLAGYHSQLLQPVDGYYISHEPSLDVVLIKLYLNGNTVLMADSTEYQIAYVMDSNMNTIDKVVMANLFRPSPCPPPAEEVGEM